MDLVENRAGELRSIGDVEELDGVDKLANVVH